jgi:hypothetical protein
VLTKHKAFIVSFILFTQSSFANYKDTIHHTNLATELDLRGLSVPTGNGIRVTQVESPFSGSGATNFMPNAANSQFTGKTITDQTGGGTASSHGTTVGQNLYGNTTSMAPGITDIDVYEAEDWLNNKGWLSGDPFVETNPLQNHSWVGFSSSNAATARMDYAVVRDGFLPIAGLYNSDYGTQEIPSNIPEIYGSMYNGITVGVSDGTHRTGATSAADGPSRIKPEIVAPNSYTSFATPYVTAAAAMLIESAGVDADAKRQQVVKAILLAAADKTPFAGWDQTTLRPLDDIYGAGQLDVYEGYFIQQAGKQIAGSTIDERGWNFASLGSGSSHTYNLFVPNGFILRNLSALITWNRTVARTGRKFIIYTPNTLANLSLTLAQQPSGITQTSNSDFDNIEHIWRDSSNALTAGNYTLTVATDLAGDYAIAWRSELYQDYNAWASVAFTTTPLTDQDPADDPDGDGILNLLEQAFGGDPEQSEDSNILPISQTVTDGGNDYLEISFRKPTFKSDLTYTVETVTDLNGTWTSIASEVVLQAIQTEPGDFDRYVYRRVAPITDHEKAFLRVSVTQ